MGSSRCGSSSTGSPAHSRTRSPGAAPAPDERSSGWGWTGPSPRAPSPRRPDVVVEQRLPEPTADAEAIERLLLARLEAAPPGAPVARVELELAEVVPAPGRQLSLFTPQADRATRLAWQLARLAIRAGEGVVGHVALRDPEAALPESRWRWLPADPVVGPEAAASAGLPSVSAAGSSPDPVPAPILEGGDVPAESATPGPSSTGARAGSRR